MLQLFNKFDLFFDCFRFSVQNAFPVFKKGWIFLIALTVLKQLSTYLQYIAHHNYIVMVLWGILIALWLYILSILQTVSHHLLCHESKFTWSKIYQNVHRCLGQLYIAFLIIIIILIVWIVLFKLFLHFFPLSTTLKSYQALLYLLVCFLPAVYFLLSYCMTLPILLIKNVQLKIAFQVARYVAKKNYYFIFGLYGLSVICYLLVSVRTWHGHFLYLHHLSFLFDLLIFSIMLPLIHNMISFFIKKN